ncbi:hypothetical protein BGZ47_011804, partial [Haplosporangium gracile]
NRQVDLDTLHRVFLSSDPAISGHTQRILHGLEKEGNAVKQTVYRDVMTGSPSSLSLKFRLPVPDVEYDLRKLKAQRLKEREYALYIPPQAKPILHSSDDTVLPLIEKTLEGAKEVFAFSLSKENYFQVPLGQSSKCFYIGTRAYGKLLVWKLSDEKDEYHLRLLWNAGAKEFCLVHAYLKEVVGLSQVDIELMKQHRTIGEPKRDATDKPFSEK